MIAGLFPDAPHFWGVGSDGAIPWLEAIGVTLDGRPIYAMRFLAIPADWAAQEANGTPYVLSIASGHPAWRLLADPPVTLGGLGTRLGLSLGQD